MPPGDYLCLQTTLFTNRIMCTRPEEQQVLCTIQKYIISIPCLVFLSAFIHRCGDSRHRYKSLHWTSQLRQVHDEPDFYALLLCDYSIDWLIFLVQLLRFGHIQFFRFRFRGSYSEILHFLNSIASSVRNCSQAASPIKIGENRLLVS